MSSVKIALVVGEDRETDVDGDELEIVDFVRVLPIGENKYIVETKPFKKEYLLKDGLGDDFSKEQIQEIIHTLKKK